MPVDVDPNNDELKSTVNLRKSGNSVVVTIAPEILQKSGLTLGDEVVVTAGGGRDGIEVREQENGDEAPEVAPADAEA